MCLRKADHAAMLINGLIIICTIPDWSSSNVSIGDMVLNQIPD